MLAYYLIPTAPELFCPFHHIPLTLLTSSLTIGRITQTIIHSLLYLESSTPLPDPIGTPEQKLPLFITAESQAQGSLLLSQVYLGHTGQGYLG